jgi:hypothetical protein
MAIPKKKELLPAGRVPALLKCRDSELSLHEALPLWKQIVAKDQRGGPTKLKNGAKFVVSNHPSSAPLEPASSSQSSGPSPSIHFSPAIRVLHPAGINRSSGYRVVGLGFSGHPCVLRYCSSRRWLTNMYKSGNIVWVGEGRNFDRSLTRGAERWNFPKGF